MSSKDGSYFIQVGSIRISSSGETIIIEIGGLSGIAYISDVDALLSGNLKRIPVKSKTWSKKIFIQ